METTPASTKWLVGSAWPRRASWRSLASREAKLRKNFADPFLSGSPGKHQSPSPPAVIVVADHTSKFTVSLRIDRIYFRFLEPSVA
jgi:hypothetical protein